LDKKELILFEDYKRGFSEIEKLVDDFEGISNGSQKIFLQERERMLKEQQSDLHIIKATTVEDIKKLLVRANSQMSAILDMEKFIADELERCRQTWEQIEGGVNK
jgi:hypothetical protein